MSRPTHCKHNFLYPACGCIEPPVLASHLIVQRDKAKKEAEAAKAAIPKKPGRKKIPWQATPIITPEDAFLDKLPDTLEDPYARQQLMMLVDAQLCRSSLSEFVRQSWHVVEPSTTLEWNWHHELICQVLQGLFEDWEHNQLDPTFQARVLNCLMNVPPGSLKPVDEKGWVTEKTRGLVRLKTIQVGDEVLTHKGRFRKVLAVSEQGELPVVEFTTGRGRNIRAEATHPILTQRGWVEAGKVTLQDTFAEIHSEEESGTDTISPEEARMLGYIIGDGCVTDSEAVSFTNQDPDTIKDFEKCVEAVGLVSTTKARPPSYKGTGSSVIYVKSHDYSDAVRNWVIRHQLVGAKSGNKRVPPAVLAGSREVILNYLSAYWSCDGTIQDRRDIPRAGRTNQTTNSVRISATTISKGLANDHQRLLQRLGLSFRVRRKESRLTGAMLGRKSNDRIGTMYVSYDVVASDQDTAAKFMSVVGPYMRHEKATRAANLERTRFDQVLNADNVVEITTGTTANCRCLQVEEDSSFVYQGIAVHNSRLLCVMFPVWCWLRRAGMKFICLSVNEEAAFRDSRDARALLTSDWFANMFQPEWALKKDQDAISNYGNTAGGIRLSKALGSEIVGLRADCFSYETPVHTSWGPMAIGYLHSLFEAGSEVPEILSFNLETNKPEYRKLQATRKIEDREVVFVDLGWTSLECTPDHKFYSKGAYRPVEGLTVASTLYEERLMDISISTRRTDSRRDVFDIQVEGNHNFFARGMLVHNCILIDDANNPKEAESKIVREGINDTWRTNIYNRVNHPDRSMRIGIQQRVHAEDWTGFVTHPDNGGIWSPENRFGWLTVVLPAEFEPDRKCITPWGEDIRTEKGESLHSARMTPEFLENEKKRFGTQKYAGQMQQRPTLAEGGMVKMRWWRFFHYEGQTPLKPDERKIADDINKTTPSLEVKQTHGYGSRWDFDWTVISLDPAAKRTERGSQHGILVIAGKGPQRFVLANRTRRGDVLDVIKIMLQLCKEFDPQRIIIEAKAAGPALMTMFEDHFQKGMVLGSDGKPLIVKVDPIEPQGDKIARLDACLPELEAGLVHLHDGAEWLEPFIGEVCGFPLAQHDDIPDALSQALNHMRSWNSYQLPSW